MTRSDYEARAFQIVKRATEKAVKNGTDAKEMISAGFLFELIACIADVLEDRDSMKAIKDDMDKCT